MCHSDQRQLLIRAVLNRTTALYSKACDTVTLCAGSDDEFAGLEYGGSSAIELILDHCYTHEHFACGQL